MIRIKEEDRALDLGIGQWLESLVIGLGEEGMSSDESDTDEQTGTEVFYANKIIWRKNVEGEMDMIDEQRKNDKELFSRKGSRPTRRLRPSNAKESRRDPPTGLFRAMYKKEWLEKHKDKRSLDIRKGNFDWMKINCRKR
jgi:hypothetical protein